MIKLRYIASWHEREDVALVFPDGREIPAVQVKGTGSLYVRDGYGHRHVITWRQHEDRKWLVLDRDEDKHFSDLEEVIRYLETLGGEPIPQGRVAAVGQIGGELVYASVPATAGAGE